MGAQANNPFSKMTAGQGGDGTGGYGVTQTNGKYQSVPQIDPTAALNYYHQAGQVQSQSIAQGNTAYQGALQQAASQIIGGYTAADETLMPLSSASSQALTLFQQMLGITPAAPTANFSNDLLNIDPTLTSTAQLISQANAATDPTQRAVLSQQVQTSLANAGSTGVTAAQSALTALGPDWTSTNPGPGLVVDSAGQLTTGNPTTGLETGQSTPGGWVNVSAKQAAGGFNPGTVQNMLEQNQADWQNKNDTLTQALTAAQARQQTLSQFAGSFNQGYSTAAPPQGFTGQQVNQQIANTPGYQFQLDQGNQQILRNQAAVGNLGTGNTQIALANYGQGLAQNYYNSYMGSLSQLINTGTPATQQLSSNQANEGGYLSNLTQLGGQASYNAASAEGTALANALNNQGNTAYNAAALNTQLQFDAYAMNQHSADQAASSAAGMAGAALQSSQANASGAGFYQGMNAQVAAAQNYMASDTSGGSGNVSSDSGQSSGNV